MRAYGRVFGNVGLAAALIAELKQQHQEELTSQSRAHAQVTIVSKKETEAEIIQSALLNPCTTDIYL